MRALVMLLGAPCFAFGLATAAGELMKPTPPPSAAPTSLIWANRIFPEKADFATWLKARGVRYKDWALNHPEASSVFEPSAATRPSARTSAEHTETPKTGLAIGLVVASALGLLALLAAWSFKSLRPALPSRRRIAAPRPRVRLPRPALPRPALHGIRLPLLVTTPRLSAARIDWAALRQRVSSTATSFASSFRVPRLGHHRAVSGGAQTAAVEYETDPVDYDRVLSPRLLRRLMPDLVWYGSSILLALVIGASIALYLH